ncbi:GDSL-type esterase/lipase family protein [Arthrobacter bambusae]|uniref:GDSL-type esterase/lipase family protein n=1 Tax=Arthrobacter bambusae TaxID=1338426 RepID=UPI00278938C4|nr:GDSL-type esterase/lipase family protein [Arthrobacter bambusae]MDQ0241156.1 hypothetical protein [Arthrobacter bambusae]
MTKQTLTAIGDSQTTLLNAYQVPGFATWAAQLTRMLRREGYSIRTRAFGIGGERTDQFLARADAVSFYDTPLIVAINGGINDKLQSIADATIQANLQALIKVAKFGVRGDTNRIGSGVTVSGQASLPATANQGDRYVVLSDTSTTGGIGPVGLSQPAKISGTIAGQTVWECAYPGQSGERGWYRIATNTTTPTACTRVLVIGYGYQNWTTGGDTPSTPLAANAALRADQQAAVTAENVLIGGNASVVFVDVYAAMLARINAGTDPDFSAVSYDATKSWHAVQNDLHHNSYGHALVAQFVRAAIPSSWLS